MILDHFSHISQDCYNCLDWTVGFAKNLRNKKNTSLLYLLHVSYMYKFGEKNL
jgi:hypothetical protein